MKQLLFLAVLASAVLLGFSLSTGQPPLITVAYPLLAYLALSLLLGFTALALTITAIIIIARREHINATAASKIVGARAATKGCNPLKGDLWRKEDS